MNGRAMTMDEFYSPNPWIAFGAALGFHVFLLMWDPTILKASAYHMSTPMISIKLMDHLPVVQQPKPVVKPVEKKRVKKARKNGLSMHRTAHPMPVSHQRTMPKPKAARHPFVSKITMPKFVPREMDEPIAASPIPGAAPAARFHATQALSAPPILSGRTRGVRAQDIHFQLSDRGSIPSTTRVVAIPIGEESGETAALPSAPTIHEAPIRSKAIAGYRFAPGDGSGSGELVGKSKHGVIGYHGAAKADSYIEGSLSGTSGNGRGGKVVSGKGFEIGGPVGDRKITQRRLPEYPAWAEEKGITALVKIYFTVRPDGTLRTNMRIVSSSGYEELDDLAKQALQQWRFSPTSDESSAESAWGIITFRFTLS